MTDEVLEHARVSPVWSKVQTICI